MTYMCRKTVRATVILLPLLGLHWILTIYRPQPDGIRASCHLRFVYDYLNVGLDGLQGTGVAIAFCYKNAEVMRAEIANILSKIIYTKHGVLTFKYVPPRSFIALAQIWASVNFASSPIY